MQCTINDYPVTDGTISGGWSLTGLRLSIQRILDVVTVLGELSPQPLDRNKRRVEISFSVGRVHESIKAAEQYINEHEATIPRTGDVKLLSDDYGILSPTVVVALIVNGNLLSHELTTYIGKYTVHTYRIVGSLIFAPTPEADHITTEAGDRITTETGDTLVVE